MPAYFNNSIVETSKFLQFDYAVFQRSENGSATCGAEVYCQKAAFIFHEVLLFDRINPNTKVCYLSPLGYEFLILKPIVLAFFELLHCLAFSICCRYFRPRLLRYNRYNHYI